MSGEIIRVERHKKDYFTAQNEPFNDSRLSFGARGILAYLLSKPDDWELRNEDLYSQSPAGRSAVMGMLKELKECGYLRRYRVSDGKKIEWVTEIYETKSLNPDFQPEEGNKGDDYPKSDLPKIEKPERQETDTSGTRRSENPKIGKPTHIISNDSLQITESTSNTNVLEGGKPPQPPSDSESQNDLPEPANLTLKQIKTHKLTATQWQEWLANEQSGRERSTVIEYIEQKLNHGPPAVHVYRENANRFPPKKLWGKIADLVGEGEAELCRWGETIAHYIGCGWNPSNVVGMMDFFSRNEIPGVNPSQAKNPSSPRRLVGQQPKTVTQYLEGAPPVKGMF